MQVVRAGEGPNNKLERDQTTRWKNVGAVERRISALGVGEK